MQVNCEREERELRYYKKPTLITIQTEAANSNTNTRVGEGLLGGWIDISKERKVIKKMVQESSS